MDLSLFDHNSFKCIGCGRTTVYKICRVVDALARPDLIEELVDDHLHRYQCPHCDEVQTVGTLTAILQRDRWPHLFELPNAALSLEMNRSELERLIDRLQTTAAAAWRPEWNHQPVEVPHLLVPMVTERDVEADVAAAQAGRIQLSDSRAEVQAEYNRWLAWLAEAYKDTLIRRALTTLSEADGPSARIDVVRARPVLLEVETGAVLDQLMATCEQNGLPEAATFRSMQELLDECREFGPDLAEQRLWAHLEQAVGREMADALRGASGEATSSSAQHTEDRSYGETTALQAVQAALAVPDVDDAIRIDLLVQRDRLLIEQGRGRRPEDIDDAVASIQAALAMIDVERNPARAAPILQLCGVAHRARIGGDPIQKAVSAAAAFSSAAEAAQRTQDWDTYKAAVLGLANAHRDRALLDRPDLVDEAIRLYESLLAAPATPDDRRLRAIALTNLGLALGQRQGLNVVKDRETALHRLHEAQSLRNRHLDRFEWAVGEENLGAAYLDRLVGDEEDNLDRVVHHFEQALAVYAALDQHTTLANAAPGLANALVRRRTGDRDADRVRASELFEAALQHQDATSDPYAWAGVANDYANLLSDGGGQDPLAELHQAIELHRRALELRSRASMPQSWAQSAHNLGDALLNLALASHSQGLAGGLDDAGAALLDEAERCLRAALEERTYERSPLDWAASIESLARVLMVPRRSHETAGHDSAAGCVDAGGGPRAEAVSLLEKALRVHGGSPLPTLRVAQLLGEARSELGQWEEAVDAYAIAVGALDSLYTAALLEDTRARELTDAHGLHAEAAYAAMRAGNHARAVALLERGRARALGDRLARDRAGVDRLVAEHPALHAAYLDAAQRCRAVEALSRQLGYLPGEDRLGLRPRYAAQARDAHRELDDAVSAVRDQPGFHDFMGDAQPLTHVARALASSPFGALVYTFTTARGSGVLLIRAAGGGNGLPTGADPERDAGADVLAVEGIRADALRLDDVLAILLGPTEDGTGGYLALQHGGSGVAPGQPLDQMLEPLGGQLMGPLAAALRRDVDTICLVPCGPLGLLPLHAAPYEVEGHSIDGAARATVSGPYVRAGCLLDEFTVTYVPSARALALSATKLTKDSSTGEEPTRFVGVADPPVPGLRPLPAARSEVEAITALLPASTTVTTFIGDDATQSAVVAATGDATHVHLACHGKYVVEAPLGSCLELADAGLPLSELLETKVMPNARLVVMSACQSAVTDLVKLPDEAIGLPAAMLEAGATAAIGTLWPVDDEPTALLMTRFYELLFGTDLDTAEHIKRKSMARPEGADRPQAPTAPAEALCRAQLWLRDLTLAAFLEFTRRHPALAGLTSRPPFVDPRCWAAFVHVGS